MAKQANRMMIGGFVVIAVILLAASLVVFGSGTGDNRMVVADYDQWAGSFENNFIHALAENIGFLVPTDRISIYAWRTSVPIDYQVLLDVVRCDGQLGEDAFLVARWSILKGQDKELLVTSRSSIREPVTGSVMSPWLQPRASQ